MIRHRIGAIIVILVGVALAVFVAKAADPYSKIRQRIIHTVAVEL